MKLNDYIKKYPYILLVLFLLSFSNCATDSGDDTTSHWKLLGSKNQTINVIKYSEGNLFLATQDGISLSNKNGFTDLGLENRDIIDIVIINEQEMIAAIQTSTGRDDSTLFRTTDKGASWQPYMGNWGGEDKRSLVSALMLHPDNPDIIYARGAANVAKSNNGGQSWESIYLTWEHIGYPQFVTIDNNNPDIIWAGGANAIFYPNLVKSEDGGENWQILDDNLQIIENTAFEATAFGLVVKPGESSYVLLGLDVGVFRSTDSGQNWESVLKGFDIRTLTQSIRNPITVYASGINQQGTVFFARSPDFGESWEITQFEDGPAGVTVNDMVAVEVNGQEVLYLGTDHGLYSYAIEE